MKVLDTLYGGVLLHLQKLTLPVREIIKDACFDLYSCRPIVSLVPAWQTVQKCGQGMDLSSVNEGMMDVSYIVWEGKKKFHSHYSAS